MDELRARLGRWVAAGAISREQADAILAVEAEEARQAGGRRTVIAEALGYVGGTLALVAGVAIGAGQFARLGDGGKIALLAVVTTALLAAGWWLRGGRGATVRRLGSLLWFLSVGSFAGVLQVWVEGRASFWFGSELPVAAGATAYAAALWLLERRSLQQVALFLPGAATAVLLATEVGGDGPRPDELPAGWALLALGAAWLELGRRGVIRPRRTSEALAALALTAGAETLWGGTAGWALLLGLVLALGLVVAGSVLRRTVLLGMGSAALLLFLAEVAGEYWTSLGPPLAILLVGIGLVAVAVIVSRLQQRGGGARAGG
jgi:hypothetical protein